jgi:hypothetical protein
MYMMLQMGPAKQHDVDSQPSDEVALLRDPHKEPRTLRQGLCTLLHGDTCIFVCMHATLRSHLQAFTMAPRSSMWHPKAAALLPTACMQLCMMEDLL